MKNIILFIIVFLIGGLIFFSLQEEKKLFPDYATTELKLPNESVRLYIADTQEKQEQGLSGVVVLPQNEGMIFTYEKAGNHGFWMKDMNIPLDFIFLNNNKVIYLLENISPNTYPAVYSSNSPSDKIIEVNSGFIKKNNIKEGITFHFE